MMPPGSATSRGPRYEEDRSAITAMLKNYSLLSLLWVVPAALLLGTVRFVYLVLGRRFEEAFDVAAAWGWNLAHLPGTLVRRRRAQKARRVRDRALRRFMESAGFRSPRWFATAERILEEQRAIDEADEGEPIQRRLRDRTASLVGSHPVIVASFLAILVGAVAVRELIGAESAGRRGAARVPRSGGEPVRGTGVGGAIHASRRAARAESGGGCHWSPFRRHARGSAPRPESDLDRRTAPRRDLDVPSRGSPFGPSGTGRPGRRCVRALFPHALGVLRGPAGTADRARRLAGGDGAGRGRVRSRGAAWRQTALRRRIRRHVRGRHRVVSGDPARDRGPRPDPCPHGSRPPPRSPADRGGGCRRRGAALPIRPHAARRRRPRALFSRGNDGAGSSGEAVPRVRSRDVAGRGVPPDRGGTGIRPRPRGTPWPGSAGGGRRRRRPHPFVARRSELPSPSAREPTGIRGPGGRVDGEPDRVRAHVVHRIAPVRILRAPAGRRRHSRRSSWVRDSFCSRWPPWRERGPSAARRSASRPRGRSSAAPRADRSASCGSPEIVATGFRRRPEIPSGAWKPARRPSATR